MNIALCGFYGKNNFGDDLLARCLTSRLSINDNCVTVYSDFENDYIVNGFKNPVHVIKKNDVVIVGGGGLVDPEVKFWLLRESNIRALKANNKLVIFLNVNAASQNYNDDAYWKSLLELNSYWFVRDKYSLKFLSSLGFKTSYLPDISFDLDISAQNNDNKRISVFLNDYVLHDLFYSDSVDNYIKAQSNIRIIARFLDWMAYFGWTIEFIPSQVTKDVNDVLSSHAIISIMKKKSAIQWPVQILKEQEIIDKITNSNLIVSMRYHSTAVAIAAGVPCLDITHHPKNRNLLSDTGLQSASAEYHNLSHEILVSACNFAESEAYKIKALNYCKEARNLWDNFDSTWNDIIRAHYDR